MANAARALLDATYEGSPKIVSILVDFSHAFPQHKDAVDEILCIFGDFFIDEDMSELELIRANTLAWALAKKQL